MEPEKTGPESETPENTNMEEEELEEEEEEFIDYNTAVEVKVDEEAEPMSDDEEENMNTDSLENKEVKDDSTYKITSHQDSVYSVTINEDGRTICSGGGDDRAYFHKIENNNVTSTLLPFAHKDSVSCSAFNTKYIPDKTQALLAVGAYDGSIQIYNTELQKACTLEGPSDVEWVCFHPNGGAVLLAGSNDGTVWMFHVPSQKCLQVFVGHGPDVVAGSFSTNGKAAISAGGSDGTIKLWAPKTGVCKHSFPITYESRLTCMDILDDLILVGCEDGSASLVSVKSKKKLTTLHHDASHENSIESVGFFKQQSQFHWCATATNTLKIWDLSNVQNEAQCRCICDHEGAVITKLKWHDVMPIVFTSTNDGIVRAWDARSGDCLVKLTGHTDMINDMDLWSEPNGKKVVIATAGDDRTVRVFNLDLGTLLQ